jgi:DNA-binding transcriptional LysR family regulator
LEIRNLKTFVKVCEVLSFQKAAKILNYAQSTVSTQIQTLEQELGTRLFDRLGRQILLTQAGEKLLDYARKLLDLETEACAAISDESELGGSLVIRVPESLATNRLGPVIAGFHKAHPKVRLEFITCAVTSLKKDLRKGFVDLAFLITNTIISKDLKVEALAMAPLVLVAGPGHPLAQKKGCINLKQLKGHTLVLTRVDCSYRYFLEEPLRKTPGPDCPIIEMQSIAGAKKCLAQNIGISLMPLESIKRELKTKELMQLDWELGTMETAVLMIWHQEKWISPALKNFMEICRKEIKSV